MIQKCSLFKVMEVFFREPTNIHFIKGISRKIRLAPTSVRNYLHGFLKENLISKKESKPFDGYAANRENDDFIYFKKCYNLFSLKDAVKYIVEVCYPKLIVVFGSYCIGEDVEGSDIDILVLSKQKKELELKKFEKILEREINVVFISDINELDESVRKKVLNGFVAYGGWDVI